MVSFNKFDINSYYFSLILVEMQKKITFNTLLILGILTELLIFLKTEINLIHYEKF